MLGTASPRRGERHRPEGLPAVTRTQQAPGPTLPLIAIRNLTKLYRMGDSIVRALNGVDLTIERGEFVAIIGPSGSGKSTMMHLLGCLDRPTAGTYEFNGRDVGSLSDRELAIVRNCEIGFVFQTFNLINRTSALANVGVPLFYARRTDITTKARVALDRVGLTDRATHRPNELSGGERQRVAIARAIVNDPLLLLADEPTGNLDTRTGEQILEIFHALNRQGVTIVVVTHEPDIAAQARRIVAMRDGKVVSDETAPDYEARLGLAPARRPQRTAAEPRAAAAARSAAVESAPAPGAAMNGPAPARSAATKPNDSPEADLALPPRMARGATTALVIGAVGPLLALALWASAKMLIVATGGVPRVEPGVLPPTPMLVAAGLGLLSLLAGLGVGCVAIFWGRSVLHPVRQEPGHWLGVGRARLGIALGALGLAMPFLLLVLNRALGSVG